MPGNHTVIGTVTFVAWAFSAAVSVAQPPTRVATVADLSTALEETARLAGPAVVQIFTTSYTAADGPVGRSADLVSTQRASGSGVIVDATGYIVTNAHVVRGAQQLRVELPSKIEARSILGPARRTVEAQVIGIDLETDLAVIKVAEQNLPALAFGDSDLLRVGQLVLALGSPLGFQNSVSLGVVSAVARQLEPDSPMIYVQTDASINPGSSGGPLVDLRGRIVGINTLIVSQGGVSDGLGLAAPSNIVRTIYDQIRKSGRVRRGDIGIRAQTLTPVLAAGLQLPRDHGVVLADVRPGGPAHRAGLRPTDIVLSLDGKPMENGRQLQVGLYRLFVGDVVVLEILRDGRVDKFPVAIAERSDPLDDLVGSIDPREHLVPRLGILAIALSREVASLLPQLRVAAGVVVIRTIAGAIDTRDGELIPGDVIYAVNRSPVTGLKDLQAHLAQLKRGDSVVLQLDRQGELMFIAFTAE
jgi:serine protease Do